jgi:predicted metal-dependent enzyme (double-stranded beta helix superfamily)
MPTLLQPRRAVRSRPSTRRAGNLALPDLVALVEAVASERRAWEPRVQFPHGADRWWTRLHADRRFDLWLLTWLPGHNTELHDHGPSAAAFAVVSGVLSEVRIGSAGQSVTHPRAAGSVTWLAPGELHNVSGAGHRPAISIHAYSPPLREMNYFALGDDGAPDLVRSVRTNQPEEELAR